MNGPRPEGVETVQRTLTQSRSVASALGVSVIVLTGVAALLPDGRFPQLTVLANPAALLGLVSPVIGYRLFLRQRERGSGTPEERCALYGRALLLSLAVTEGVAVLGVLVHLGTGVAFPLVAVLTHILLTGALWPTHEKIEDFIEIEPEDPAA